MKKIIAIMLCACMITTTSIMANEVKKCTPKKSCIVTYGGPDDLDPPLPCGGSHGGPDDLDPPLPK